MIQSIKDKIPFHTSPYDYVRAIPLLKLRFPSKTAHTF